MPTTSKPTRTTTPVPTGGQRCICCKPEGWAEAKDVPQPKAGAKFSTDYIGLWMLGHPLPDKNKKDDIRFAPWDERGISWVKKPKPKVMTVDWPDGTGPMCCVCSEKCRTLPCGVVLPVQHLESAWWEWWLLGNDVECVLCGNGQVEQRIVVVHTHHAH